MSVTAGTISLVSKVNNVVKIICTVATAGTGPYTYQYYKSTTTGFSPGGGNIISGATSLSLTDSTVVPGSTVYYKNVATDTGASNATATTAQLAVVVPQQAQNQNQFAQASQVGILDLKFNYDTLPVQIDSTQATALYPGMPVKMVDGSGGVPKVVGIAADTDEVLGYLIYNVKNPAFLAGMAAEISLKGNVMFLYSTAAIARGAKVVASLLGNGVGPISGSGGETVVGWALDKATASGQQIRVFIETPYFGKDGV